MSEFVRFSLSPIAALLDPRSLDADPIELPILLDTPLSEQRVKLDDRWYDLRLDWIGRQRRWHLSLYSDGVSIATGRKIVPWTLLLTARSHDLAPRGILAAVDFSDQQGEPPDFADLGRRVKLLYWPAPTDGAPQGDLLALAE